MSVITEFTIPAEAFALQQTFEERPNVTIEIERLATHSREWIMPFLWATGADGDAIENALQADTTIDNLRGIDVGGNVSQFKVEWNEDFQNLIDDIVDQHGIMQEAEATDGMWYLKLKFVDQDAVSDFQTYFHERGVRLRTGAALRRGCSEGTRVRPDPRTTRGPRHGLASGYFAVPREAQLGDWRRNSTSRRTPSHNDCVERCATSLATPSPSRRRTVSARTSSPVYISPVALKARPLSPPVTSVRYGEPRK